MMQMFLLTPKEALPFVPACGSKRETSFIVFFHTSTTSTAFPLWMRMSKVPKKSWRRVLIASLTYYNMPNDNRKKNKNCNPLSLKKLHTSHEYSLLIWLIDFSNFRAKVCSSLGNDHSISSKPRHRNTFLLWKSKSFFGCFAVFFFYQFSNIWEGASTKSRSTFVPVNQQYFARDNKPWKTCPSSWK